MSNNNGWPCQPGVLLNPDRWRGAINDALTNWLSPIEDHETPKDALQRLIRLEVMAALDPAVSQSAADLVAQAKRDAMEEAARVAERSPPHDPTSPMAPRNLSYGITAHSIAAAIRALSDTPTNMVLVPREPTEAMIQAVGRPLQGHAMLPLVAARIAWDAMVKAAEKGEGND
jgi:hypothetical protein